MRVQSVVMAVLLPEATLVKPNRLLEVFALFDGLASVHNRPRHSNVCLLQCWVLAILSGCPIEPLV